MKNKLLFTLLTLLSLNLFSQETFQKGYIIFNDDSRQECLIKYEYLLNTPYQFSFKTTKTSEVKKHNTASVKEFGIYSVSKYIRFQGKIDRTSLDASNLPNKRSPKFREEILFLNVLVEGEVNLYEYVDNRLKKYFFQTKDGLIEQLIKINYLSKTSGDIKENNYYKQQLINTLNPVKFNKKDVKWLNYHKDDLSELISKYNNQFNNGTAERNSVKKTKVFYKKNKRQFINITPHIGFNNSELIIDYAVVNRELNFGRKSSIIYGLEVEGIIPYFKKKFSFLFDASFQSHKISGTYLPPNTPFEREISGNYKAIDLGIGLRYRLLLKNKSLLYTNFIMYSTLKHTDKVSFSRGGSIDFHEQNIYYGSISLGYKFKNKYSVEVKTSTKRNINEFSERSKIKYLNHAIVFGYTIF